MIVNGLKLALLLALVLIGAQARAAPPELSPAMAVISVVLSGDKPIYATALAALQQNLAADVRVESYSLADWETRLESASGNQTTLLVAIGATATERLLQANQPLPLLSMLVPSATFRKLLEKYPHATARLRERQLTGLYMDQPAQRQLNLAMLIGPGMTTLGTLYDVGAGELVRNLEAAAASRGLEFKSRQLHQDDNPLAEMRKIYTEIDAYIAVPGKFIFNRSTAKWMLYLSLRSKKPLLGFSQEFVRAGALAAVYSTPEDIGRQAAGLLHGYLNENVFSGEVQFPAYFSVAINRDVAALFKLEIGSEESLIRELGELEKAGD